MVHSQKWIMAEEYTKDQIREEHIISRLKRLEKNYEWIMKNEQQISRYIASPEEISPESIKPDLVFVDDKKKSALFRYATFYWSIPVSSGFGRKMRFLVIDRSNEKLIGILGLCDPVIGLSARDKWIGWSRECKNLRLWHVMDAHVLGSVPPYNDLLGSKLVALLALTDKIREIFHKRYHLRPSWSGKVREGHLVLLTTIGAFGKSSVLDRLKRPDGSPAWIPVGWTKGEGTFHIDFEAVKKYLESIGDPIVKRNRFGQGPNWKMRVIERAYRLLGIKKPLMHGIKRMVYMAPLAYNAREFLCCKTNNPEYIPLSVQDAVDYWKKRWMLPRSSRLNWHSKKGPKILVSHIISKLRKKVVDHGPVPLLKAGNPNDH